MSIPRNLSIEILKDSPSIYWDFTNTTTDGVTTYVVDGSGNGRNGTRTPNSLAGIPNVTGLFPNESIPGAYSSQFGYYLSDSANVDIGVKGLTVEVWARSENNGLGLASLGEKCGVFTTNGWALLFNNTADGVVSGYVNGLMANTNESINYNDNVWHHYVLLLKRGKPLEIIVDTKVSSGVTVDATTNFNCTDRLAVGNGSVLGDNGFLLPFKGAYQHFCLYDYPLSYERILAHFLAGTRAFESDKLQKPLYVVELMLDSGIYSFSTRSLEISNVSVK